MSVIVEFSIAAGDFILGKALQETSGLSVELEKMIPTETAAIPYFWVLGSDTERFDAVLEREPELSEFEVIDEVDGRRLYRAAWDSSADTFVQTIVAHEAVLQEASGDADSWRFQLLFPDPHHLSEFHTACKDGGIDLSVERIYNPITPAIVEMGDLTEAQRTLIERLYEEGYFEVPRKTTLAEFADELGVSDQAVNERLRRGVSTLIEATLKSDTEKQS